jgi:hypothetical protein
MYERNQDSSRSGVNNLHSGIVEFVLHGPLLIPCQWTPTGIPDNYSDPQQSLRINIHVIILGERRFSGIDWSGISLVRIPRNPSFES